MPDDAVLRFIAAMLHNGSSSGSIRASPYHPAYQQDEVRKDWPMMVVNLFVAHAEGIFGLVHTEIMSVM